MTTTPEVNTTINSVLEHPQLGPSLVQWLPLHEVLRSLQLASTGIQAIVEDTLVESYVQGSIQGSDQHRLSHKRPHYWISRNYYADPPCEEVATVDKNFKGSGGKPGKKKTRKVDFSLTSVFDTIVQCELQEQLTVFSPEGDTAPLRGRFTLKLKDYLVENVFTSELRQIGSFLEGEAKSAHQAHSSLTLKSLRGGEGPEKQRSFSLPESVHSLPDVPATLLAMHEARASLKNLEILNIDKTWFPAPPKPKVVPTVKEQEKREVEELDEFAALEDLGLTPPPKNETKEKKVSLPRLGHHLMEEVIQACTKLRQLSVNARVYSEGDPFLPVQYLLNFLAAANPATLEKVMLRMYHFLESVEKIKISFSSMTQSVATTLDVFLLPAARILAQKPNLRSIDLPTLRFPGMTSFRPWSMERDAAVIKEYFDCLGQCKQLRSLVFEDEDIYDFSGSSSKFREEEGVPFASLLHEHCPNLTRVQIRWGKKERDAIEQLELYLTPEKCRQLTYFTSDDGTWKGDDAEPTILKMLATRCPAAVPWGSMRIQTQWTHQTLVAATKGITELSCRISSDQELEDLLKAVDQGTPNQLHTLKIEVAIDRPGGPSQALVTDQLAAIIAKYTGANLKHLKVEDRYYDDGMDLFGDGEPEGVPADQITDLFLKHLQGCPRLRYIDVETLGFSVRAMMCAAKSQWPDLETCYAFSYERPDQRFDSLAAQQLYPQMEKEEDWVPTTETSPHLTSMHLLGLKGDGWSGSKRSKETVEWYDRYIDLMRRKGKQLVEDAKLFGPWYPEEREET